MKNIFYDRPNPVPPLAEQAQKLQKALDAFAVPVTCVVAQPAERPHIAFVLNDNDDPILNVELSSDAHTLHEIADEAEDHVVNYPGMDANDEDIVFDAVATTYERLANVCKAVADYYENGRKLALSALRQSEQEGNRALLAQHLRKTIKFFAQWQMPEKDIAKTMNQCMQKYLHSKGNAR